MKLLSLPYEVQELMRLENSSLIVDLPWVDYLTLGINSEHIPVLIEVLEEIDDYPLCEDNTPCSWLPLHAWRALAQLQAENAIPTMINLLNLIDEEDDEIIQVDLPVALSRMCPAAVPLLNEFMGDPANGPWARLAAAEALQIAAVEQPDLRRPAIEILSLALETNSSKDVTQNSVLVDLLKKLNAAEAAPLVEQLYTAKKIDVSICGDWEDFQVGVGLLKERLSPPPTNLLSPTSFLDGIVGPASTPQDRKSKPGGKAGKDRRKRILAARATEKKKK